ncbi:MAG: hypothetical protein ACI83B_002905, partial [Sediminicola sp.]
FIVFTVLNMSTIPLDLQSIMQFDLVSKKKLQFEHQ